MQIFSEKVNKLLLRLEQSSEQFWNVPREVAEILYFLVRQSNSKIVLEIGASNGYSAIFLGEAVRKNGGKMITIESHLERSVLAQSHLIEAGLGEFVDLIKGHAPEVFTLNDQLIALNEIDFVFMDATKKQHLEFLKDIFGKLRLGGLIVMDNVLSHWHEMEKVDQFVKTNSALEAELVRVGDGLLFIKKIGEDLQ